MKLNLSLLRTKHGNCILVHLNSHGTSSCFGKQYTYTSSLTQQIFQANKDETSIVKHPLANVVQARFVRFYPVTDPGHPCMRVEVFVQQMD